MRFDIPKENRYQFHPLAEIFPMMDKLEFSSLVSSMELGGYKEYFPILLFDGKILDGRNRYKASLEAQVEPSFIEFEGSYEDAQSYNMAANMHRRHFSKSQMAMIAAKAIQVSRDADGKNLSVAKAALLHSVSQSYIKNAITILNEDSEIAEHVFNGSMQMKEAEYRIMQIQEARVPNEYDGVQDSIEYENNVNSNEQSQSSMILQEFQNQPEEAAQRIIDLQREFSVLSKKLRECEERNKAS